MPPLDDLTDEEIAALATKRMLKRCDGCGKRAVCLLVTDQHGSQLLCRECWHDLFGDEESAPK